MRSFIVLRLFGLILLSLGAGLVTILLVFNGSGPSLSNISTEENFNEIMIYGSYTYGFFIDFFNYSSFLLTIFFLASGFKIFFNFGKRNFIIQFLFFLVGFSLYNFSAQYFGLNNAKFGELLLVSVGTMLENFFSNYYLITLIYIVFLMLSLFLIFYSIFRFILEFYRAPDPQIGYLLFHLTFGQILSVVFLLFGIAIFVKKNEN